MIHAVLWIEGTPSPVTFHLVGHSIVSSKVSMNHWHHVHLRSKHWACPRKYPEERMASRKHHKTNKSSLVTGTLILFYTCLYPSGKLGCAVGGHVLTSFFPNSLAIPKQDLQFCSEKFNVHVERHSIENIHDFPMLFPLKYVFPWNIRINHTQTQT